MYSGTKTVGEMLETFRKSGSQPYGAEKIHFEGTQDRDVYNITAPFEDDGEHVIAARVEHRDSEDSEIYVFVHRDGKWVPRQGAPVFRLQDPFYTKIRGNLIFGGVQTFPHPVHEGKLSWRTVFYKGERISHLQPFFVGPDQMKDLRLVELRNGSIGVFTRPQGEKGGRGKIGFTQVPDLKDLNHQVIEDAPLLEGLFTDEEWGGCNEIHVLSNGLLGVLGHVARYDEMGRRQYYAMTFVFDPVNFKFSDPLIIAERSNFPEGPSKRDDLVDVVFSGGLIRHQDGTAELYAGVSDAEAHKVRIKDPFLEYER